MHVISDHLQSLPMGSLYHSNNCFDKGSLLAAIAEVLFNGQFPTPPVIQCVSCCKGSAHFVLSVFSIPCLSTKFEIHHQYSVSNCQNTLLICI